MTDCYIGIKQDAKKAFIFLGLRWLNLIDVISEWIDDKRLISGRKWYIFFSFIIFSFTYNEIKNNVSQNLNYK